MKPYTVVLIYPDYAAQQYGEEFWTAHVNARDVASAQRKAQREAMAANRVADTHKDLDAWAPVFVCEGHHFNLAEN